MKVTKTQLKNMVKEALLAEASSLQNDVLPGSGNMAKISKEVDDFLMKFAEEAKELTEKIGEELKVDMLGGISNPSLAPRIGERNRMLMARAGVLKKLMSNAISAYELIRREG